MKKGGGREKGRGEKGDKEEEEIIRMGGKYLGRKEDEEEEEGK
jgi:hypothetical protein